MKKLTSEDLLSLQYGDTVYHRRSQYVDTYRYVGRMPSSQRYLIFSYGEKLKHLYIDEMGNFIGEWFTGVFDDKFLIKLRIEEIKHELETLRNDLKKLNAKTKNKQA